MNEFINSISNEIIDIRRKFHQIPELAYHEFNTSTLIIKYLKSFGYTDIQKVFNTGVVAKIDKGFPFTIAIRMDIDGLPIHEENDVPYQSINEGFMHACGHDAHIAILLGVARVLKEFEHTLSNNVVLIFQPAEEGAGGALPMIKEGVLDHPNVDMILGGHVWPDYNYGTVELVDGIAFASDDYFDLTIKGKGGHGAKPECVINPIEIGTKIIDEFQKLTGKHNEHERKALISVCSFVSQSTHNVFGDYSYLKGIIRTLDKDIRNKIDKEMEQIIQKIAQTYQAQFEFNITYAYPNLVCDKTANALLRAAAYGVANEILDGKPQMTAEDFAFFAEKVKAGHIKIGCSNEEKGYTYGLHNSKFQLDERAIIDGVKIFSKAVFFN